MALTVYVFLHNMLNILVQIANKMGLFAYLLSYLLTYLLCGLSPQAKYTDRATATRWRNKKKVRFTWNDVYVLGIPLFRTQKIIMQIKLLLETHRGI
jgi:hypothetical protein